MHYTPEQLQAGTVIAIDKPLGWTSFQALKKVRNVLRCKIGHAGTLDPLATGLLLLATGKATRTIPVLQEQEKEYTGTITLGATTPSCDLETEVETVPGISPIAQEHLLAATELFKGPIQQKPPMFSAIKTAGRRSYDLARQGQHVEMKSREVVIKEFELTRIAWPEVDFRVVCSKGTYIRSLARDYGRVLGCGGYLSALCRTRIGSYRLEDAVTPDQFAELFALNANAGSSGIAGH